MRLFLAEKPSLARAIAQVLPPPHRPYRHHIECGAGNVVAWCAGHILEPVMPDEYDRKYARWAIEDLPIVPRAWKLRPSAPDLLSAIRALLRGAARVVHAGDPDREGQLLVDEVLDFLGYEGPVDRILVRDTNPDAVRRELAAIEPNEKYRPLGTAALARQRADWLYGLNMTRLYSLLGRAAGYERRVLSIGRVQTPLLGLIARRDAAIESFLPAPYYVVSAAVRSSEGGTFSARWSPEAQPPHAFDEEGRLVREDMALAVVARATGAEARVTRVARETKTEPPPLPYSLADLQIDAARRLGLSAQAVLQACQALYETHRVATYPRSDCSYLPEGHLADAKGVLAAIGETAPGLAGLIAEADVSRRSRAWNDTKVTAHHAIIPTRTAAARALGPTERAVYDLIARRYVSQFFAPYEYAFTRFELDAAGERFVATGRETLAAGWRKTAPGGAADRGGEEDGAALPTLKESDSLTLTGVRSQRQESQPPKPFTDATLMHAMVHVAAHVSDPRVKAILTEADGLGTPATRPSIIETLFERGYIARRGKAIVSTAIGRALVASLPESATTPDRTAEWEAAMRPIADGTDTMDRFLERTAAELVTLIAEAKSRRVLPPPPPAAEPSSTRGAHRPRASNRSRPARG